MARRFVTSSLFRLCFLTAIFLLLIAAIANAQTTSVSLVSDHAGNSSVLGEAVKFTATVSDTTDPLTGFTPSGWVTFKDGTAVIGRAMLNGSAEAAFTTSLLGVGNHTMHAYYEGDANFPADQSTPGSLAHTANKRDATVAIGLDPATVGVGMNSTITATVTDAATTGPPGTPGSFAAGLSALPVARSGHTATLLPDGKVLIAGGKGSGGTALASLVVYNPADQSFSSVTGDLNAARSGHTATLLSDGRILFAGGNPNPPHEGKSAELYTFNSSTNSGSSETLSNTMSTVRFGHTATLLASDTVLIAGGESGTANSTAELFSAGSFADVSGHLATHRVAHSATLLSANTILFAGGDASGTFEIYTYTGSGTGSSLGTAAWATARSGHTATMLLDGSVLIIGGNDSGTPVGTLEIYDVTAGSFVPISGTLPSARSGHTATLLNSALVLVTGGLDATPATLTDVQRYTPSFDPRGTVKLESDDGSDAVTPPDPGCTLALSDTPGSPSCSGSVTPASVGTGSHAIKGTYSGDGFHTGSGVGTANLTVKLAVTASVTAANKTYDGTTAASITDCALTGVLAGDTVTCSAASASFGDANVGTGKTVTASGITLAGAQADSYVLTSTTATTTANITAKDLTITGVTASNKTYDGTTDATLDTSGAALSGVLSGDTVNLSSSSATGAFGDKNVGDGKPVTTSGFSISGAQSSNYRLVQPTPTANITPKALTVSATGVNKPYDGNTTATVTLSDNRVSGDVLTTSYSTATFADKNVGSDKTVSVTGIAISGTDAGNYTVNTTASTTANITALAITGSITAANKVYDGNKTATITGRFLNGVIAPDVVTYVGGTASFADKKIGTGKTVTATGLSLDGADAGNYTVNSTATTTADITAGPPLVGSITVSNKVYDGTTSATISGTSLVGVLNGDEVTYTGGTASFSDKNVGTTKTVTATGMTLTGKDAGNYTVNATATTTADITVATLTVTAIGVNKVYDANTSAVATLEDNRASGDVLTTSYTTAVFADKNAGTSKTVSVSGISISGTDAGNYVANNTANTTANITPLGLTSHVVAADKVYDGTASATITTRSVSGVLGSDAATLTGGTATFDNKNVGTGKTVTVTGLTLSGADAGNYSTSSTMTTTASITPASTTASLSGLSAPTRDGKYQVTAKITWQFSSESPAGTVVFTDNGAALQTVTVDASGQATLGPIPVPVAAGQHNIKASYTPDANLGKNFAGSEAVMTVAVTAPVSTQPGRVVLQPASVTNSTAVTLVQCRVDSLAPVAPPATLFPACDVDPKSLPAGSSTLTVKVQTVSGATATLRQPRLFYAMWLGLAGIVSLPFAGLSPGKRGRRRKALAWLSLVLIIAVCSAALACGGGFSNPNGLLPNVGGPGATQPGQYVVVVSGTAAQSSVVVASVPVNVGY